MARSKIAAGIDVGSSKVTVLMAQADEETGALSVLGAAPVSSRGVRKGQVVKIEEAVEAIVEAVEAAERMAGYNLETAFVSVTGAHIESQNSRGVVAISDPDGEITYEDVLRVIEAAKAVSLPSSREIIHVLPREFIVDGEAGIKDPVGMTGVRLEVETHIVTGSTSALKNLEKCVAEVGVEVGGIVFSGVAAAEAVLSETEKELGVVLVDIGGGTTSIAVFSEGALSYSAVLPIGARNVTSDLAIGLRVSMESSEKIKLALSKEGVKGEGKEEGEGKGDELDLGRLGVNPEEAKVVSRKTLVEGIIRPRMNELFTMVGMKLKESGFAGMTPAGVVVTGGGAMTVGVVDSAKRMLSLPVRVGEPKGVTGLVDEIMTPEFAVPVGLLKYAAERGGRSMGGGLKAKGIGKSLDKFQVKGVVGRIGELLKSLLP